MYYNVKRLFLLKFLKPPVEAMRENNIKKILIVDDEANNLQLIVESIEEIEQKYDILLANNAIKAISITKDEMPDLIITDWEMPGIDGIEYIRMVKRDEQIAHIPILMCTGVMVSSEHLKAALEAGALDFIRKPFDKIELNARLNSTMKLADNIKKVRDLNAKKERILSIIAHDLRSPIGGIRYLAKSTLDCIKNVAEMQDSLERIEQEASNTYDLLNNLLLWIKIPNPDFYHPEIHNLLPIIENSTNFSRTYINERKISISIRVDDIKVICDKELIASVIRNLVTNAIKFSKENGEIAIYSQIENGQITVSISDNGIGMTEEQVNHILTMQKERQSSQSNNSRGWGIGLSLASQILDYHKTKLQIISREGSGTTINFSLPVANA